MDLYPARLDLAAEMGATHLIDGGDDGVEERLADILGDGGADVFVDNTGLPRVVEMGYRLTSAKGRVVMVGVPNSGDQVSLSPLPLYFGKELTGSHGGEAEPSSDIPRLMGLLDEGLLELDNLINAVLPLGEINEAIQSIRSGELAGRCLLAFDED